MSRLLNGSVDKPHAMITGASRGIGVYIAQAFARRGYNLTLVARSQPGLENTQHLLREERRKVVILPADLSVAAERIRLVEEAISQNGPIDVLVNNAGLYQPGLLEERGDEEIESEIQLNLCRSDLLVQGGPTRHENARSRADCEYELTGWIGGGGLQ